MPAFPARSDGAWRLALLVLCGEVVGVAALLASGTTPPAPIALVLLVVVAAVVGLAGTWLFRPPTTPAIVPLDDTPRLDLERALAARTEQQRRLRHDIRGVLSPVMLTADRLVNHADPAVKRSGEILLRTVERATTLLAEPPEGVSPPADP